MPPRLLPSREVVLGPVHLPEGVLTMRTPRLADADAWSRARLANRKWLEGAFPAWGDNWDAEQSPAAWAQRWWHLRRAAAGGATPFVILLDGRLIGELGVDAIDTLSWSGEASVWMVRDHGSAKIMNAASLLLFDHAFTNDRPLERMLSPVATTSRRGRTPGLSAVGFQIEATVPRPVGRGASVDHDIWIVHNTAATRAGVRGALAGMGADPGRKTAHPGAAADPGASPPAGYAFRPPSVRTAVALARGLLAVAAESGRSQLAGRQGSAPLGSTTVDGDEVAVTVDGTVRVAGHPRGRVDIARDVGTAALTMSLALVPPSAELASAVVDLVAASPLADGLRTVEVRRPLPLDDGELWRERGFELAATYAANPEGPRQWPGERVWVRPADWTA